MKEIIATCEESQCGHWTSVVRTISFISQNFPGVVFSAKKSSSKTYVHVSPLFGPTDILYLKEVPNEPTDLYLQKGCH